MSNESRVGGPIAWLQSGDAVVPKCKYCESTLSLLAYIAAPVPRSQLRSLHVYFCASRAATRECLHSWLVFRETIYDKDELAQTTKPAERKNEEKANQNDWLNDDDDDDDDDDLFAMLASRDAALKAPGRRKTKNAHKGKGKKGAKKKNESERRQLIVADDSLQSNVTLPIRWIGWETIAATTSKTATAPSSSIDEKTERLLSDYESNAAKAESSSEWSGEQYEDMTASYKTLHRFQKAVAANPQQSFRYAYGGAPLLYEDLADDDVPACDACGAPRRFELQLMPALVYDAGDSLSRKLDFGTVLVFTCSANCESVHREFVVMQEPV
jgi:pre-rRNA-processing protein TSR4